MLMGGTRQNLACIFKRGTLSVSLLFWLMFCTPSNPQVTLSVTFYLSLGPPTTTTPTPPLPPLLLRSPSPCSRAHPAGSRAHIPTGGEKSRWERGGWGWGWGLVVGEVQSKRVGGRTETSVAARLQIHGEPPPSRSPPPTTQPTPQGILAAAQYPRRRADSKIGSERIGEGGGGDRATRRGGAGGRRGWGSERGLNRWFKLLNLTFEVADC